MLTHRASFAESWNVDGNQSTMDNASYWEPNDWLRPKRKTVFGKTYENPLIADNFAKKFVRFQVSWYYPLFWVANGLDSSPRVNGYLVRSRFKSSHVAVVLVSSDFIHTSAAYTIFLKALDINWVMGWGGEGVEVLAERLEGMEISKVLLHHTLLPTLPVLHRLRAGEGYFGSRMRRYLTGGLQIIVLRIGDFPMAACSPTVTDFIP
ncbi:hypothetical protein Tco_0080426 [Tanacetum coccineum]